MPDIPDAVVSGFGNKGVTCAMSFFRSIYRIQHAITLMLWCGCTAASAQMNPTASSSTAHSLIATHVPDVVATGRASYEGPVDSDQHLTLEINLPLRNQTELAQLLEALYDPNSPRFQQYLSVAEFTDRFNATSEDYAAVARWAAANGLTITSMPLNRRLLVVDAPVSAINKAFNVTMQNYAHPTENRSFFSPDREPSVVGLEVGLLQITGMNNYILPRSHLSLPSGQPQDVGVNLTGSGSGGNYLPSDMRAAYYGPGPLTGASQSIGIFSFDGYLASDLALYYSSTGMSSSVPITNRLVAGYSGACTTVTSPQSSTCNDGEQILDIVNAIGMAPGIANLYFYEGSSDTSILNEMATDNLAKSLSASWSWSFIDASSDEPIFEEFAAQGQSFFVASGDCGAYNSGYCNAAETQSSYGYPEGDPYVISVGGTDLTTSGPGGTWVSESAWYHSGGGYISAFGIPNWQQTAGVITATNSGSTLYRNGPDIAAEANYDNVTVNNGVFETGFAGTSYAAPRWAGFMALANQQAVANGHGTMGFIDPTLYSLGVTSNYSALLHDISSGNNAPPFGGGSGFNSVTGYDLITGWGSPYGQGLINQLAGTSILPPTRITANSSTDCPAILVSWTAVSGATSYQLYQASSTSIWPAPGGLVYTGPATSKDITTTYGINYLWKVAACYANGCSAESTMTASATRLKTCP